MKAQFGSPGELVRFYSDPCMVCGRTSTFLLDRDALKRWQSGELIQNAFPNMSPDQREVILTGTHGECWDKAFAEGEL